MPLITINAGSIYRLAIAELQTALSALGTPVPVVTHDEEDPADGSRFVRLHAIVEGDSTRMPNDADARRVVLRAPAQVPATDLRTNGLALTGLAHDVKSSLAGQNLAGLGHRLVINRGTVEQQPTGDESLRMRDAQITWHAIAERETGND